MHPIIINCVQNYTFIPLTKSPSQLQIMRNDSNLKHKYNTIQYCYEKEHSYQSVSPENKEIYYALMYSNIQYVSVYIQSFLSTCTAGKKL